MRWLRASAKESVLLLCSLTAWGRCGGFTCNVVRGKGTAHLMAALYAVSCMRDCAHADGALQLHHNVSKNSPELDQSLRTHMPLLCMV